MKYFGITKELLWRLHWRQQAGKHTAKGFIKVLSKEELEEKDLRYLASLSDSEVKLMQVELKFSPGPLLQEYFNSKRVGIAPNLCQKMI